MTERIQVSALVENATQDVKLNRLAEFGRVVEVAEVSPNRMVHHFFPETEDVETRFVSFMFDHSITHYIGLCDEIYAPRKAEKYGYSIRLKECNKKQPNTNITPDLIEALVGVLGENPFDD